jgi:hypothetical protein
MIYDDLQRGIFRFTFSMLLAGIPPCQEEFPINETTARNAGKIVYFMLRKDQCQRKKPHDYNNFNALTATIKKKSSFRKR